jgi:hypothetical protein
MKAFVLSTFVLAILSLYLVDLRIQKNHVVRDKLLLEAELSELCERQARLQGELQMELADPKLELYIVDEMELNRDFTRAEEIAVLLIRGNDSRRVDAP